MSDQPESSTQLDQPESNIQPDPTESITPAMSNPAVAFCCNEWDRTYDEAFEERGSTVVANYTAAEAYRWSLPPLTSPENIRDFIACIAQGMLIQAIKATDGARLLYAAQVAHTALPHQPSRQRSKKTH